MRGTAVLLLVLGLGCGAAAPGPDPQTGTGTGAGESSDDDGGGDEAGSSSDSGPPDSSSSSHDDGESGDDPTTDDPTTGDPDTGDPSDGSDTAADPAVVELYRGAVAEGVIDGWDPDDPRPLVMMGRQDDEWVATLARIAPDGSLSDNVAEEIVVWGFTTDPPVLYDGAVGGTLDGWDPANPIPLVMMGQMGDEWVATLASVQPDGTLGDNVAERIIVWGWSGAEPGAPDLRYEGPVAGGALDGWDPDAPDPLVMLGTPGFDLWLATLVRIAADGSLSDNLATSVKIWSW